MRLHQNWESPEVARYGAWLLDLEGGKLARDNDNMIEMPHELCLPPLSVLIDWVLPYLTVNAADFQWMSDRAIPEPLNSTIDWINELVTALFPDKEHRLLSADSIKKKAMVTHWPFPSST